MTDVILNCQPSDSSSAVNLVVSWIRNGGAPIVVKHPNADTQGAFNEFQATYLTDTAGITGGGVTAPGDVISVTVWAVDASGNASAVVTPTPGSVTIPTTPPDAPTSATLSLK